jgi:transcriptional regulator with XRE-family HTH domain
MKRLSVFAARLKQARLRAKLSQKELGKLAGIDEFSSSPRINQYERAKHAPDYSTAERLAKVLDVPAAFLYARDDDLAELVLLFAQCTAAKRRQLLKRARIAADGKGGTT